MGKNSINLHGHSHGRLSPVARQYDVGIDAQGLQPVSLAMFWPPRRSLYARQGLTEGHRLGERAKRRRPLMRRRMISQGLQGRSCAAAVGSLLPGRIAVSGRVPSVASARSSRKEEHHRQREDDDEQAEGCRGALIERQAEKGLAIGEIAQHLC